MASVTCPTCRQDVPIRPTPQRPVPHPDPRLELLIRLAEASDLTASSLAATVYGDSYTPSQLERCRRRLMAAVHEGALEAVRVEMEEDGSPVHGGHRVRYVPSPLAVALGQYRPSPAELLTVQGVLTARALACQVGGTDKPTASQVERARRQLERLVESGDAFRLVVDSGEIRYQPATAQALLEQLDL